MAMADRGRGGDADELLAGCDQEFTAGRAAFQTASKQPGISFDGTKAEPTRGVDEIEIQSQREAVYRHKRVAVKFLRKISWFEFSLRQWNGKRFIQDRLRPRGLVSSSHAVTIRRGIATRRLCGPYLDATS